MTLESADVVQSPEKRALVDTATRYIADVSTDYPASVIAQGAALSQKCHVSHHDPLELRDALMADPDRLARMARTANAHHKGRENPTVKIPEITAELIKDLVKTDFVWANRMMILSPAQVTDILTQYPDAITSQDKRDAYLEKTRNMIQETGYAQLLETRKRMYDESHPLKTLARHVMTKIHRNKKTATPTV